jgi:hypothetical protein
MRPAVFRIHRRYSLRHRLLNDVTDDIPCQQRRSRGSVPSRTACVKCRPPSARCAIQWGSIREFIQVAFLVARTTNAIHNRSSQRSRAFASDRRRLFGRNLLFRHSGLGPQADCAERINHRPRLMDSDSPLLRYGTRNDALGAGITMRWPARSLSLCQCGEKPGLCSVGM